MHIEIAERGLVSLRDAAIEVRKAFYKQLLFLERSLLHPSLHAKKYDEGKDLLKFFSRTELVAPFEPRVLI